MDQARRRDIRGLYRWMEAYIDGDTGSFVRLHACLEPKLRSFLLKLVAQDSAVDDLVQLALLKAHLARDRFALQGGDPDGAVQGWYFAIARNVAMDFLRDKYRSDKHRVRGSGSEDAGPELADASPTAEELGTRIEAEQEIVHQVRDAIAQLPPGQREVVELHKLQGMSMAQVAERLQVREGAVRVRAHRAYKTLARLLGPKALSVLLAMGSSARPPADPMGTRDTSVTTKTAAQRVLR